MYRSIYVDVDLEEVVEDLDDADLKELGLVRVKSGQKIADEAPPGFGNETPVVEQIRMVAVRGDLPAFIEATRSLLDEQGIFLRTDRLLPAAREVAHG